MGYRKTIPVNVMLTEACEPRLEDRSNYLGYNYILKVITNPNHMLIPILDEIRITLDNPLFLKRFSPPLIFDCYMDCDPIVQLIEQPQFHCIVNTRLFCNTFTPIFLFRKVKLFSLVITQRNNLMYYFLICVTEPTYSPMALNSRAGLIRDM